MSENLLVSHDKASRCRKLACWNSMHELELPHDQELRVWRAASYNVVHVGCKSKEHDAIALLIVT